MDSSGSGGAGGARRLTEASLKTLAAGIGAPTYPREQLKRSIVHLGVGGFHRAHQAVYLDDLAERSISMDWGLTGVGLLPGDKRMEQALVPQQGLYTVVERGAYAETARVVGSITRYLFAPEKRREVLGALAGEDTRIVSLTITEGGYNIDGTTGLFDAANPAVREDLEHPSEPATAFGYICEALDRRRTAGLAPFTVLSCDNLQGNGAIARKAIVSFARVRDETLAAWIEDNVAFPNGMVDRITPQTTDADRDMVTRVFGIDDAWPVVTEPFTQWVLEDHFSGGRPPLEEVGVQIVSDVHPYETMKLRLLNASHQALGYLGYLAGYRYVHEVMGDPDFRAFIARMMDAEVTPLLPPVPGVDLTAYKRMLLERFANPKIRDQLTRLCTDGSDRMPKFLLPSIAEALASGRPHRLLTLAVAGWFRYLRGVDERGEEIVIADPLAGELRELATEGGEDPRPLLGLRRVVGDLGQNGAFVTSLEEALRLLYTQGARATLSHYLTPPDA